MSMNVMNPIVFDPIAAPAADPKSANGSDNATGQDGCGRACKIIKYALLGTAIGVAVAGTLVSGAILAAGVALMFFPGAGTLVGGSLAFLGATLAGAVVVALNAAAANAGAIAIAGACGLAATAVFVAISAIASRIFCFGSSDDSSSSGEVLESDAEEKAKGSKAGSKNPAHSEHGSQEELKADGALVAESGKVVESKKDKKAKKTNKDTKLEKTEKKRKKNEAGKAEKSDKKDDALDLIGKDNAA